jgi:DNA-directed RNA polymerase, mitochondrial
MQTGVRIKATPEQAKRLVGLPSGLVEVISAGERSSIEESGPLPGDTEAISQGAEKLAQMRMAMEESEDMEEGSGEEERKKMEKATKELEVAQALQGKFVNVVDLFPPVPAKGSFNVEVIKQSPYFFS